MAGKGQLPMQIFAQRPVTVDLSEEPLFKFGSVDVATNLGA